MKFIDTHVHFWDLAQRINDWVENEPSLKRNFILSDYLSNNPKPEAIITVEAANGKDSLKEAKWIEQFITNNSYGIKIKHIAFIDILQSSQEFINNLQSYIKLPIVIGFRHILSYSSSSRYSPAAFDFTKNTKLLSNFNTNLAILKDNDYIFNCQMYPDQLLKVQDLIIKSGVRCIVDHCGLPILTNKLNYLLWLNMLKYYKDSGIKFKLSGFDINNNELYHDEIISTMLDGLHSTQLVYGSNYPLTQSKSLEKLLEKLYSLNRKHLKQILFKNIAQL